MNLKPMNLTIDISLSHLIHDLVDGSEIMSILHRAPDFYISFQLPSCQTNALTRIINVYNLCRILALNHPPFCWLATQNMGFPKI